MDRFLLAENPMNSEGITLAIIHTINPISIIGVIHERTKHARPFRQFVYKSTGEAVTLYIHHMFTTNIAATADEVSEEMIAKLLNRAWQWYKAYLEWEDSNID